MHLHTPAIDAAYQKYQAYKDLHHWELANKVLYDCCDQHPLHTDEHEIVTKIWLIGRTYAAAIERCKAGASRPGRDFYYDSVAVIMKNHGTDIDNDIRLIQNGNTIDAVLQAHGRLTKVFCEITGLDKRSLASKYLHFHCPDTVYIYDSRADAAVKKLVGGKITIPSNLVSGTDVDATYADFCTRAQALVEYIKKTYNKALTPRQLDDLLLYCV